MKKKKVFSGPYMYKLVLPEPANTLNEENKWFLHGLCSPPTGKTALLQAVQILLLNSYRRKMENQLQQRYVSGVWKSLKTISGQRTPDSQAAGDQTWVNDMNRHPPLPWPRHLCCSPPPLPSLLSTAPFSNRLIHPKCVVWSISLTPIFIPYLLSVFKIYV